MARWLGQLLVLAVVAGVALTALATPASAHGQLAMSTPAKDSTVKEPMESLALYFTEKPAPNAYFTVTTPSGARVDEPWSHGQPKRLDEPVTEYNLVDGNWQPNLYHTGFPAIVPVAYWPEQGLYVARYVSVASDGEKVTGEVKFTYKGKMSQPPKGWKAPTNEPDPALLNPAEPGTTAPSAGPVAPVTSQATPQTTPQAAASNAPQATSGFDLSVWLLPALLVVGAGFMVVRAARRPSPRGAEVRRRSTGPPGRKPPGRPAAATSGKARSGKAVKTAKRR
ncbi:copper resistance CopC family protein [Streptosporangium vulgare]|uniref:Copper resistance protein CopC n=1 Tax=Streptosporangium vulgare TaxID=46190 RepID=A0ABV5TBX5_9ACTN